MWNVLLALLVCEKVRKILTWNARAMLNNINGKIPRYLQNFFYKNIDVYCYNTNEYKKIRKKVGSLVNIP